MQIKAIVSCNCKTSLDTTGIRAMAAFGRRSAFLLQSVKALKSTNSIACRFFSAAPKADDDIVKKVFQRQQKNFRTYLEEISKDKFVIDPNNESAVKAYYEKQSRIRENLGIAPFTQKIADLLEAGAEDAPNVRAILELNKSLRHDKNSSLIHQFLREYLMHKLKSVRIVQRCGIEDDMGADEMMFQALSKVESSIGKPLTKEDANGCSMWKKEIDKINAKLKIKDEDLEMYEEEAEYAAAKAELEEYYNVAFDKIDSIKRRDDIKIDVSMSDMDHRTYL